MIGEPVLPSAAGLGSRLVDEIDDIVEAAAGAGANAASRNSDGKMDLAGPVSPTRMALGYADEGAPVNSWRSPRAELKSYGSFLGFE